MLTREQSIVRYDFERGRVVPDRLTRQRHAQYVGCAERALAIYANGNGLTRRELHRGVRRVFAAEPDCPARRIDAFCKLLDDASNYESDRRRKAAKLRREVFRRAARHNPLVEQADRLYEREERQVKAEIARELGKTWEEIDRGLFADVIEFQRLREFAGYDGPRALLARYNVAQCQTALFDAVRMTVTATADFKTILRYARLARLMHTIERDGEGYRIMFDGPASALRRTRRYGAAMARFLPALIACREWRMHAVIETRRKGWPLSFDLSPADGLHSHLPPPAEFDSGVEASFAERWGDQPREGWRLIREGDVLTRDQKVFVPDFVLRHESGQTVLLEIVGFWTPEYLEAKLRTLEAFAGERILLAVAEAAGRRLPEIARGAVVFKKALKPSAVLERLRADG